MVDAKITWGMIYSEHYLHYLGQYYLIKFYEFMQIDAKKYSQVMHDLEAH